MRSVFLCITKPYLHALQDMECCWVLECACWDPLRLAQAAKLGQAVWS